MTHVAKWMALGCQEFLDFLIVGPMDALAMDWMVGRIESTPCSPRSNRQTVAGCWTLPLPRTKWGYPVGSEVGPKLPFGFLRKYRDGPYFFLFLKLKKIKKLFLSLISIVYRATLFLCENIIFISSWILFPVFFWLPSLYIFLYI